MLKKGLKFSIVIAVICLSSVMCNVAPDVHLTQTNFNIQGKVTDATDGTGIGGTVAIASLFGYKCVQYADRNDGYYIRNCSVVGVKGSTQLYVSGGSGYNEKWVDLEITSNLQTINVALQQRTQ